MIDQAEQLLSLLSQIFNEVLIDLSTYISMHG